MIFSRELDKNRKYGICEVYVMTWLGYSSASFGPMDLICVDSQYFEHILTSESEVDWVLFEQYFTAGFI